MYRARGVEVVLEKIRVVCAHDCPDMCSLLARVESRRITRIEGDPDQPFTAGCAWVKVNRDAQLVHSPVSGWAVARHLADGRQVIKFGPASFRCPGSGANMRPLPEPSISYAPTATPISARAPRIRAIGSILPCGTTPRADGRSIQL